MVENPLQLHKRLRSLLAARLFKEPGLGRWGVLEMFSIFCSAIPLTATVIFW